MEFGYELLSAVPYAYELHLKGELEGTISGHDTEALYYFSPKHTSNDVIRGWHNMNRARRGGLPYTYIHQYEQVDKQFPPYKEHYANTEFKWKKPTLVIGNRKNKEWNVAAINYFDNDILDWMFSSLKDKYEIIYFPIRLPKELQDNVDPEPIGDEELARDHGVKIFHDLVGDGSWNETILKVFANCEHYITMNGGYSILASLFSGTNIIYSKPGQTQTREIAYNSFWRWYPNHNDTRTTYVPDYISLQRKIQSLYIDEDPCINILLRTTRPNYLKRCMASIAKQDYENINVVLICDDDRSVVYTRDYPARMVRVQKCTEEIPKRKDPNYGKAFPANKYLDQVQKRVKGYVMFLDDDDKFTREDSVSTIAKNVQKNKLLVWKVDFNHGGKVIPSFSFGKGVTLYDITGIGFCYHTDHIKHTDWSEWKRADYRTAKQLSDKLGVKWVDEVLTGIQTNPHGGSAVDLLDENLRLRYRMKYPNGKEITQCFTKNEIDAYKEHYERQGICIEPVI